MSLRVSVPSVAYCESDCSAAIAMGIAASPMAHADESLSLAPTIVSGTVSDW
jgi:hypothetical protein